MGVFYQLDFVGRVVKIEVVMGIHAQVQELLADTDQSLIAIYLQLQQLFEAKYGTDTVVLMEVGSFFEIYGVDNATEQIGKTKEIAEILNIQLTRKNKNIPENNVKNPLMAGFPSATFDRYVQKLVRENKYTIAIIRQQGAPPKVTRYLDTILSPGVNFEYSLNNDDNFTTSLIVEQHKGNYSVGYAAIDVTTGRTSVFEIHSTQEDATYALDQLFSLLKSHEPDEVLLTCDGQDLNPEQVRHYLELSENLNVHTDNKRLPITYQNELFKQCYEIKSFLSSIEYLNLEKKPLASEALAILLEFIIEHDRDVVKNIAEPQHINDKNFLYLGNNPLEQLNIISLNPNEQTVLRFLDNTRTSFGRRLFKERLMNPIIDQKELEARYNLSDALMRIYTDIDSELKHIYDIDRLKRRIQLGRLHPFELNFLYDSLVASQSILTHLTSIKETPVVPELIEQQTLLQSAITDLETTFNLDETTKYSQGEISQSFFQAGFNQEIDTLIEQKNQLQEKLETIRTEFVHLIEQQTGKPERDYVVIKHLEKDGHHITITKSRYFLIEQSLSDSYVSIDGTVYALSDFNVKVQTGNVKITADIIKQISEQMTLLNKELSALVRNLFRSTLEQIDTNYSQLMNILIATIGKIDVALSNIKASLQHNLVRPEILSRNEETSYLELLDVRHPLVEAREENGIYIPNDVVMGDRSLQDTSTGSCTMTNMTDQDARGVLLYGINSSGKSSLMKSLGICIILAQSGFFVPARQMRFTLLNEIFTRIVAKDNFEKGLSSFAVEMMEMKNIFNRSTPQSLILGDEISRGTETLSALAIVGATIQRLSEIGSLFMFTTHLHQLHNMNLLKSLPEVISVHLHVHYDEQADKLIFDRTLQAGSGSSVYGLEFAESLHMDKKFLSLAAKIRQEIAQEEDDLTLLTKKPENNYNQNLYATSCALCTNTVSDIHHIAHQKDANEHGHIKHFHKNHKYNLVPLCENCHHKVHKGEIEIRGFKMTSNGLELDVTKS
jgi:DNA mismatch repair protein MutS